MANVAALTMQLEDLKDKRAKTEKIVEAAQKSYTIGLVGILLGIPLLFVYGCGLIFIIAGALAAVTQGSKRSAARKELAAIDEQISEVRQQIANAATE